MFTTKGELDAMGCSRRRSAATRSSTPSRSSTRARRFHPTRSSAATAWRVSSRPCALSTPCRPAWRWSRRASTTTGSCWRRSAA